MSFLILNSNNIIHNEKIYTKKLQDSIDTSIFKAYFKNIKSD